MKKYGLQLRADPSLQKKKPSRPPLAPPSAFFQDDDGGGGIKSEIARHATKNKSLRDIEEQHKKALAEDPSIFDYDGVYDEMKEETVRPREQDRQEGKSKYIEALMNKAKVREREHEIIYERKLAKERSKDDHLFADKEKFVTSAYKKKLAKQAKWLEEERIRQLREEKDDVGISTNEAGEKVGTFALAYAAHKAASPIRFPPTVALTPIVASLIGRKKK
ncbi:nuclear speckle splicing regulatory protein 1-like protein [Cinnamomum micranthum f. kanehirae]|uniref:Nuclear speckle splicing regulatory protein 1-like protein n=1 Tax=Cinnamomum micranthum f. kanehirae TaxID=337451 RepID=A0A3S3MXW0_9MAGN|nr:nuclear speckle splicing regulatory protein 1-like protein [Cinnamomum micranthum f. kanehirae]